jgi:hypothetical protein
MNICLKEKEIKEKKSEKKKEKRKPFPLGWAESGPSFPPSLPCACAPPSLAAHATHLPCAALSPDSPTPPVSRARPFSLATALSLAGGPRLSAPFPLARDRPSTLSVP